MKKVYACLCGEWYCLNDDPDCVLGPDMQSPAIWYEEGAIITKNQSNDKTCPENQNSYYNTDYIFIHYRGKDYRINPIFIQITID